MPKRSIPKIEGLTSDVSQFLAVLNNETDIAVVLVSTGYLDACLGALLENHFINSKVSSKLLDSRSGAIGSFSARADLCYCLGLIPKGIYKDLTTISEIRNEFAHHHLKLDFETENVVEGCKKLDYAANLPLADKSALAFDEAFLSNIRTRFVVTVVVLSQHILNIGRSINRAQAL